MDISKLRNSELLEGILKALYTTAGRRTTQSFAIAVLGAITKTLEQRYDFLKNVIFHTEGRFEDVVVIDSKVNSANPVIIAKAIETIVQVLYMDLKEKAGLYFIKELMRNAGDNVISNLRDIGVDLELLQLQQLYLYKRQSKAPKTELGKKQDQLDSVSLLGYSWENVSTWKYDTDNKLCIIYNKDGKELDRLNLDTIVKNYIDSITDDGTIKITDKNKEEMKKIKLTKKDLGLLKIIQGQDTDFKSASVLLQISQKELDYLVRRLLALELLHYISSDEVALTEIGLEYLKKEEKVQEVIKS
jgi:hypothetical protein